MFQMTHVRTICIQPVADLYGAPHHDSEVVSQLLYGWEAKQLGVREGGFEKVRAPDGYEGWMLTDALYSSAKKVETAPIAKVIRNAAHLYRVNDLTKHKALLTVPFETHFEVVAQPADEAFRWIQVKLVDGSLAWIQRGNVTVSPGLLSQTEMLALSKQFLGLPYTWGGVSSFGFDCSGYVQMLFRQRGIHLPRDARDQIRSPQLASIPLSDLSAGDLLFFGPNESKITHVALCLEKGQIIHAVGIEPTLLITSLNEQWLADRYAYRTARRLV